MISDKEKAFREELAALFNKHGFEVASCGCCGGTIIVEFDPANDLRSPATLGNVDGR
ncbi:hypothetical protein [Xanthomonas phage Suba]|uniref:Uncharacterized protein n=1 Tax=Xanthomonas phage Suba TaxID=2674975 RepID=A0A679K408_9CAUD|nr:hypothetical protein QAY88_gp39 [Xanthomonas phage Suba]CAA2409840.1 hypothetical protein [Xanthomonas phage Suba]